MKARFLVLVLAASAVAAPVLAQGTDTAPIRTTPFTDVPKGHWAYDAVEQLRQLGILRGYPGGTFEPKAPAPKASAVKKRSAVVRSTAPRRG